MMSVTFTAQKMMLSIKDFFGECEQIQRKLNLLSFTKEMLNGKRRFCAMFVHKMFSLLPSLQTS